MARPNHHHEKITDPGWDCNDLIQALELRTVDPGEEPVDSAAEKYSDKDVDVVSKGRSPSLCRCGAAAGALHWLFGGHIYPSLEEMQPSDVGFGVDRSQR